MKLENLKIGDTIRNKNPFNGEGEYIVVDLHPEILDGEYIRVVTASSKFKNSNGTCSYLPVESLKFYKVVE